MSATQRWRKSSLHHGAINVVAHHPHADSMHKATLSGTDVPGILRLEHAVAADGGWVTVLAGDAEYPVAGWVAYVSGVMDTCVPLAVTA